MARNKITLSGKHYGEFLRWMLDNGLEGLVESPPYHRCHSRQWWEDYIAYVEDDYMATFYIDYTFSDERINVAVALRWGEFDTGVE